MNQSVSVVPNYGFIAVLFAAFLWGTTGTVASFAPNLSPLAVGAAAMGGGGLLPALLARKSIIYHLVHVKANAVMLGVGVIAVFIYPLAFYSSMHYAGIAHWDSRVDWYSAYLPHFWKRYLTEKHFQ